ncbi:carbonic anhydrase [Streptomyces canus]|uniref:carbonic anhydrase n=1 Tax=Streptomyces canus TaxID=58343 RepID=A0A101RMB6_9ACTN|nr:MULTISPECIES: carbonic anhydrase [Streptomyces]KUN58262.1 carbonic anhydrase [Streptomyces canus]MDI5911603.1 carbonic anhydrase [Streptomyces sp. 12257]
MTRLTPLLERNEQFVRDYDPAALGLPTAQMVVVTCLDHRIDPAAVLGLRPGDAPVIRNAGGRITPSVINDLAYLAFLAEALFGVTGPLFEVAILHHTQCGTGFLADSAFLRQAAQATGVEERVLRASEVAEPDRTVREDVERLLTSPLLPPKVSVSGHVYAIETGRVTTVVDAQVSTVG